MSESTPPVDDVREAAEAAAEAKYPMGVSTMGWSYEDAAEYNGRHEGFIEGFLAAAEFRPHGTVTDAEVEAALEGFVGGPFDFPESRRHWEPKMRAALEAAREARS